MSRIALPVFAILTFFGLALGASAQDLKEAVARQKIAAQKINEQVLDAIDRSRKQDPADAKAALRDMLRQVADSQDLLEAQRTNLRQRLQVRLSAVEQAIRAQNVTQDQRPAPRDLDKPKSRPSTNDSCSGANSVANRFIDGAKGAQQTNADLIRKREVGLLAASKSREESFVPADGDINFPANWNELTKRRLESTKQKLTAKEVALLKALNSTMSVDYDSEKFKSVINHLQDRTGLGIIIDDASMKDSNIDYDDPVTFKVQKATVRTILKKILGDKGLSYIIKEGSIQVMTAKKASEVTVLRTYQIDDLVTADPQIRMMFGPFVAQAQMQQNAQQLINLIQSSVDPSYWQPNGPGSISFYGPTRSLIIRASAEMHYQLGSPGLFGGR